MFIHTEDIKATKTREIMTELYNNPEVMGLIKAHNLRGGDFIETIACELECGNDVDTDDFLNIK